MKSLHLVAAAWVLSALSPLLAQELLQNGDFSNGKAHWDGDIKLAADEMSTDLTTNANPVNGVALEMRIHGTMMWQEIKGFPIPSNSGVDVTINYWTSSDFALKIVHPRGGDDSQNGKVIREPIMVSLSLVPAVQFSDYGGFSTPTSGFYCVPDDGANTASFQKTLWLPNFPPSPTSLWLKFWFPPGSGIIYFKSISVKMHDGQVRKPDNPNLVFLKPLPPTTGGAGTSPQTSGTTAPTTPPSTSSP